MVMCCAVWLVAPHSHDADGDSPIWFVLALHLPVRIRFRRTIASVVLGGVIWVCLKDYATSNRRWLDRVRGDIK